MNSKQGGTMLTFLLWTLLTSASFAAENPSPGAYVNAEGGPLLPLLQNAQEKIDIEIYTMTDQKVRSLLRSALRRGVKIRILKEPKPLGQKCDLFGSGIVS